MKDYYSDKEKNCPCGCGATVNKVTLNRFNKLRELFGKPVYMEQMATCLDYSVNHVGRKPTSSHVDNGDGGHAGDVKSKTFDSKEDYFKFLSLAVQVGFTGFGQGAHWIGAGSDKRLHIDDKRNSVGDFRSWTYGVGKE